MHQRREWEPERSNRMPTKLMWYVAVAVTAVVAVAAAKFIPGVKTYV